METILERVRETGIIPVIKIDRAEDALPLAAALERGGLPAAEITFRTDAAEESIRRIAQAYPHFLLAAGTVLTPRQADKAIAAGADFLVSPGTNPAVVRHCIENGYLILPGVCTPSEVEQAMALGLSHVKFFPAEAAGGVGMIRAMSAPYVNMQFMPTGGISPDNLAAYLSCKAVFACGGSWMVPPALISAGDFDKIEAMAREVVALVKEIRI